MGRLKFDITMTTIVYIYSLQEIDIRRRIWTKKSAIVGYLLVERNRNERIHEDIQTTTDQGQEPSTIRNTPHCGSQ